MKEIKLAWKMLQEIMKERLIAEWKLAGFSDETIELCLKTALIAALDE